MSAPVTPAGRPSPDGGPTGVAATPAAAGSAPRPIRRLLVANRGEIARRIRRTAAAMGIETVAVYADSDADAPHVTEADHAVALPGRSAAETYLDIAKVVAAAEASGADAVHPGYGFLSERAEFARAVVDAGLVWVGPPPEAIEAMGDKLRAKELMAAAGVPVLPWVVGGGTPDIGWPLLVKAAAGGGGKGMRVVEGPEGYAEAVEAASREAVSSFGDGTVFAERFLPDARHVEIQVLADAHGSVVHCFERECSIQRRHQKVVEEAPSPALDPAMRARMGEAALAAARAVGYRSAGTVEFVVGPDGEFFFLEVNTRLQVEHPVTEAITGLDLVREQLRIAQGEPLGFEQGDLRIAGHAIEVRLYAEDPARGFLPATGTVVGWQPAVDPAVRFDSGIEAGSVVGVEWDPMLAKVVAHAPTRTEAALRLALALERTVVRGVTTNRDFLVATLRHPEFLAGRTTTSFIERVAPAPRWVPSAEDVRAAAVAATLVDLAEQRDSAPLLRSLPAGFRNGVLPPEQVTWRVEGDDVTVGWRARRDGAVEVTVGDRTEVVRLRHVTRQPAGSGLAPGGAGAQAAPGTGRPRAASGTLDLELAGRRLLARWQRHGDRWWVQGPAGDVALVAVDRFPEPEAPAVAGALVAPMPGRVISVAVGTGDEVAEGQLLVVVEAMKMEHRVVAPRPGTVAEVRVAAGDQVSGDDLLVVLAEAPPAGDAAPGGPPGEDPPGEDARQEAAAEARP